MNSSDSRKKGNRQPAVAGSFYPGNKDALSKKLEQLFSGCIKPQEEPKALRALIAPHAGYAFSGTVAASAFSHIPQNHPYKTVFVLASSHRFLFNGAALFNQGNYETPLGEIRVDTTIGQSLINSSSVFTIHPEAHEQEHSLEVLLPFLQHRLGESFQLVPIILGTNSQNDCKIIAEALSSWFTDENLFVVSTDFSHYPNYENATENDRITASAICQNSPEKLLDVLKQNKNRSVPFLETSLCGWTSVLTLLHLTQKKNLTFKKIHYCNSGDSERYGDKERVVGYWALAIFDQERALELSAEEQAELLQKARKAIIRFLKTGKREPPELPGQPTLQTLRAGVFVSIYVNDKLRGCIGNFAGDDLLSDLTQRMAVSATSDDRFDELKPDETDAMTLEISVLSPLKKTESIDEIIPGKHGVYIKKGFRSGTFLPQVATKTGWDLESLLEHCAHDKAGLDTEEWRDAEIYTYEAFIFKG